MSRAVAVLLVVAIAAAAIFFEQSPRGTPIRRALGEWLAASTLPARPEIVTAIDLPAINGGMRALDAALILRAILRCGPRAIVFLVPIQPGEGVALLLSKLGDAKVPVVFTANERLPPLPRVAVSAALPSLPPLLAALPEGYAAGGARKTAGDLVLVAARQADRAVASNAWQFCLTMDGISAENVTGKIPGSLQGATLFAPMDSLGCARINPLARRFVRHISLDQLMLRTERSEQGAIGVGLEDLFRGRLIAVQYSGDGQAAGVAALRNRLAEIPSPANWEWIALLLVATLPWWPGSRIHRALFAVGVGCSWLLLALAIYQEFRIVLPISIALLLPLLGLIPSRQRANKIERRESPA